VEPQTFLLSAQVAVLVHPFAVAVVEAVLF
jgi:hypothetical protein